MEKLIVRPMTAEEFGEFRLAVAGVLSESRMESRRFTPEEARDDALKDVDESLPQGFETPGHVLLIAECRGARIGSAWFGMEHPRGVQGCAYLHLIAVDEAHQGRGFGRALLSAVEEAAHAKGADSLELNVYGANKPAVSLYSSSGYETVSQQMRKSL